MCNDDLAVGDFCSQHSDYHPGVPSVRGGVHERTTSLLSQRLYEEGAGQPICHRCRALGFV